MAASPFGGHGGLVNLPAVLVVAACTALLVTGTRESARANAAIVALKLGVLLLVIVVGAFHVHTANWSPFVPAGSGGFGDFGATGVLRGAGVLFFAYVGFDAVSTAAAEARDPRRTVPRALLGTVAVATLLYIGIGLILTGLDPYRALNVADPISRALGAAGGLGWLNDLVGTTAVVGLFATVLVTLYGQVRILMRMAADGLLPPVFARVDPRRRTPVATTVLCGVVAAAVAAVVPIDVLGDLVSMGTLLAFALVCSGVLVLRRTLPRRRAPGARAARGVVAAVGLAGALGLMATLPVATWLRLAAWLVLGLAVFAGYARRHALAPGTPRSTPPAGAPVPAAGS